MGIRTKSVYDGETRGEGFRLLIMRRWPRGITKARVDEWDRDLAPSAQLLSDWIKKKIPFKEFKKRYINEMRAQRDKIRLLAKRAKRETITLFCHEEEDTHCHRKMLKELIDKCR
ncbi:MAG: DUF488 domain-containing protein [Candidatus Brocadiales bacterium]